MIEVIAVNVLVVASNAIMEWLDAAGPSIPVVCARCVRARKRLPGPATRKAIAAGSEFDRGGPRQKRPAGIVG
jgi:hypothetical protein